MRLYGHDSIRAANPYARIEVQVCPRRSEKHITCSHAKDVILRLGGEIALLPGVAAPDNISNTWRTHVIAKGKHGYAAASRIISTFHQSSNAKHVTSRDIPSRDETNDFLR